MPQKQKKKRKNQQKRSFRNIAFVAFAVLFAAGLAVTTYLQYALQAPDLPEPPLKDLAANHGIRLGMLVSVDRLDEEPYKRLLTSEFAAITSDGQIHWDKFRPSPTEYDFSEFDKVVAFAEANHMPIQAHHLVWNEDDSLPKWLKEGNYSQQEILKFIEDHIKTVVSRYKGRVAEWTVVNEVFPRRRNLWGTDNWLDDQLRGTDYIDKAFHWAHKADPEAKLILNDFYNETKTFASDAQYEYMKGAKARGVPIHGIGLQMHIDASRPPEKAEIIKNMRRFGDLGYQIYVTEFDTSTITVNGSPEHKERLEEQIAANVIAACIEVKSCVHFTVFGMNDRTFFAEWHGRGRQRQLLFNSRLEPKRSYHAFRAALQVPTGTLK